MYRSGSESGDPNGVGEFFSVGQTEETSQASDAELVRMQVIVDRAPRAVLDLTDPETAKELKVAMGLAPFMMPLIFGDAADPDFDSAFFESPIWDRTATKFSFLWIEQYKKTFPTIPNAEAMFVSPHLYPAAVGALMALVVLGYRQPNATMDFSTLPTLTAFFEATDGNPEKGTVKAPFFTRESQQSGGAPLQASTVAFAGLGLLGVVTLGLLFGGKKSRR